MSESGGGNARGKLVRAFPSLSCKRLLICRIRTSRLQPYSRAARRYHSRVGRSLIRSKTRTLWLQGNFAVAGGYLSFCQLFGTFLFGLSGTLSFLVCSR